MNAVAVSALSRGLFGDTGAALAACTVRRQRFFLSAIYVCLMLASALLGIFVTDASAARPTGLGLFALLANFSIWGGWFARVLLLQAAATRLRMPDLSGTVVRALSLAALVTIPFPALILSALGVDATVAIGAPLLGALAGILFSVMPWPAACALAVLPSLINALPFRISEMGPVPIAAALIVALALLTAGIRVVTRTADPAGIPTWRRPIMLYAPGGMVGWSLPDAAAAPDVRREREGWLFAMPRPARAGPHAPRAAIDTLLAGPMGYVSRRDAIRQWACVVLAVVAILVIPFRGDTTMIRDAMLFGASIGLLAGGWTLAMRLEGQRRRQAAELPELALLPGLGAASQSTALLLGSVMRRLLHVMAAAVAAVAFLVWMRAAGWPHVVLVGGLLVPIVAASVWMCVAALGDRPVQSWRTFVATLPLLIAATWASIVVAIRLPVTPHAIAWTVVLTVLTVGYGAAAWHALRRYRARPHAFLLD